MCRRAEGARAILSAGIAAHGDDGETHQIGGAGQAIPGRKLAGSGGTEGEGTGLAAPDGDVGKTSEAFERVREAAGLILGDEAQNDRRRVQRPQQGTGVLRLDDGLQKLVEVVEQGGIGEIGLTVEDDPEVIAGRSEGEGLRLGGRQ